MLLRLSSAVLILSALAPAATRAEGPTAPPTTTETRVTIDAAAVGTPISPLIYGQFIEHLGRCIQGGLWAEMLEDRKFFYPVTGEAPAWEMVSGSKASWEGEGHPYEILVRSPWLVIGDRPPSAGPDRPSEGSKAVTMVSEGAWVGAHSPRLEIGATGAVGLAQERLSLREGRAYLGRIVVAGDEAAHLDVSLVWGGGASARETVSLGPLGSAFASHPLRFLAGGTTDNGRIEIVARGKGAVRIGAVSLMPADNQLGWRSDTLARLRELGSPVYRWPGGNFVSGYDWRDGIGDPDRRPPRKNPAWKGVEANDVGLHEFMDLCALIGAEPYVAVNTGLGGAQAAADLVAYANAPASTPLGRLRAENGRAKPFGVRLWAVGNEMYGDWQLGHVPLERYVGKHRAVVDAMRAVDPRIRPVAVGALGEWSKTMLRQAATHMSLISEHLYWQNKDDVVEHVFQVPRGIHAVAEAHRGYRREIAGLPQRNIKVALDEWNYWYGPNEYGELGTRYFLQDGLGIAAGLHELFRDSDVFEMANYAQTVNVIGAIKTNAVEAELEPTGLVLALYRNHFGTLPVAIHAETGDSSPGRGLDFAAAWTADRTALTVAIVNANPTPRTVRLALLGARPNGRIRRFLLTGSGPRAHNAPGHERGVTVEEIAPQGPLDLQQVPALSVSLFVIAADEVAANAP
jgi:alpha-L-arabinofuranosidase